MLTSLVQRAFQSKILSDPHINRVVPCWMDSIPTVCLTKYGFHTGQAYSRIGRTKTLKAVILTPLHNINRQNVMADKFILGRLSENQPYKVFM